jgi:hypothetical protein
LKTSKLSFFALLNFSGAEGLTAAELCLQSVKLQKQDSMKATYLAIYNQLKETSGTNPKISESKKFNFSL